MAPGPFAPRNGRWAIVKEKDGTISYAENESNPSEVTVRILRHHKKLEIDYPQVSGAESVLSKL